jgi:hypothetical protein
VSFHVLRLGATVFLLLAVDGALAAAPTLRMESRAAPTEAQYPRVHSPDAAWLSSLPLSQTIELTAPSGVELQKRAVSDLTEKRSVGFGRATDAAVSTVVATHGESALRFLVTSPGALHLRVAITFSDSAQYRITAYRPGEKARAVSLFRKSGRFSPPLRTAWTPITDGEAQMVVVERVDRATTDPWTVSVPLVSHFDRPLYRTDATPAYFGASAPCQVDIACIYQVAPVAMQPGIVKANFAVALMAFTKSDGLSYSCTGTLLDSASYPSPIFLTAFHCLSDAESLASLTTIWFYNRVACLSGPPNPGTTQVAGGAVELFGSASLDAALVLLNQMPPPLATYTGWDASPMQPLTPILAMHHPRGDVKKASFGMELGINDAPIQFVDLGTFPAGTFYIVKWELGIWEPGSSGSGLLSFDADTGLFYLRGTLTGGSDITCSQGAETAPLCPLRQPLPLHPDGAYPAAGSDRGRSRVLLRGLGPLLRDRLPRRDRGARRGRLRRRLAANWPDVQRLAAAQPLGVADVPLLQRLLRAEEHALLHALPRGVRAAQDRPELGVRRDRVLHRAGGRRRRLRGRDGSALPPLQQRRGRRPQSPLHDQPRRLEPDARARMGLRGQRKHQGLRVRAAVRPACQGPRWA